MVGALAGLLAAGTAPADELTGFFEVVGSEVELVEDTAGFEPVVTRNSTIARRLTFGFRRQAFPLVRLWVGGTFEDQDATTTLEGRDTEIDTVRTSPYFGIGRRTGQLSLELVWNRNTSRSGVDALDPPTNTRDRWSGTVNWRPERGPLLRASVSRLDDRDDAGGRDLLSDFVTLDLSQRAGERWNWSYRGSFNTLDDSVAGSETTTFGHRADVGYQNQWFDRRIELRSEYSLAYRSTEIDIAGSGTVDVPLFPLDGLSARDDTPLDGALDPNTALVDDDVAAGAGIDLGLPPPAGDDRPWGLGLDFGQTTTVDTLFVWIDRDLRPEVAQAYTWDVYASANNLEWTPRGSISPAPFDEFRRRFTIRFAPLSARYVKLVVRPLTPDVPFAPEFPDVFVTELDAAVQADAPSSGVRTGNTVHTLDVDTRMRLLAAHDLFFEGNYFVTDSRGASARYTLSNGLFYSRPLGPGATFSARASREELRQEIGRESALVYAATLATSPVPRLRYTLSLSGRDEQVTDEISGDQTSLFFYGFAQLYDGIDVQAGVGRIYTEDLVGNTVSSTRINAGLRVVPRRDLTAGATYNETVSRRRDPDPALADISLRTVELNAAYTPVPTLYLFGAYRVESRPGQENDRVRIGVVNWAPFPGASLRLAFNYNETRRTLLDRFQRTVGPSLRWYLNPRAYLNVSYVEIRDETASRRVANDIFNATLRLGF